MNANPDQLRGEVAEGLRYAHSRANANTAKLLEVASFAYAAIELLAERDLIQIEDLDDRKAAVSQRLVQKFSDRGMGVARQQPEFDKYTFESTVEIDCPSRLHLCKAACCRLNFALSRQDVEEGVVQWDFAHPYLIAREEDGYCRHLDRKKMCCSVHAQRPVPCRAYDCRQDKRIWEDFEKRVVSPDLEKLLQSTPAIQTGGTGIATGQRKTRPGAEQ